MRSKKDAPHFEETQRFRHSTIFFSVFLAITLLCFYLCAVAMHEWLEIFGDPNAAPNGDAWALAIIAPSATMAMLAFLVWGGMISTVTSKGLFIQFIPFHLRPKPIDLSNIKTIESGAYRPIMEFGGWGIRYGWNKKAYNVFGNQGVRITYKNGRQLLIGSQRPDELKQALTDFLAR